MDDSRGVPNASLKSVELCNFKSFEGVQVVGPLERNYMAVVGPNGTGKSNLMDAMCFVMADKSRSLRVNSLRELVFGASFDQPTDNPVYVKAHFVRDLSASNVNRSSDVELGLDAVDVYFTRNIVVNTEGRCTSVYEVNNTEVTAGEYQSALLKLGVNIRAKNFLIFQGQVETVATMSARERAAILDELSGSAELRGRYTELRSDYETAVNEEHKARQLMNTVDADLTDVKKLARDGRKFTDLHKQLLGEERDLLTAKLQCNQLATEKLQSTHTDLDSQLTAVAVERDQLADRIVQSRQHSAEIEKQKNAKQTELAKQEFELSTKRGTSCGLDEQSARVESQLDKSRQSLTAANEELDRAVRNADKLKADLKLIEDDLSALEQQQQGPLGQGQGVSNDQIAEFYRLQGDVKVKARELLDEQRTSSTLLHDVTVELERENNEFNKLNADVEPIRKSLVTAEKSVAEIDRKFRSIEKQLETLENTKKTVQEITEVKDKLHKISEEEKDLDIEKTFYELAEKKRKVVDYLQSSLRGICGRLVDLCRPVHARYQLAVTKIMSVHMDSIVCDNNETALRAIDLLKLHKYRPETFLPLATLLAPAVDISLRNEMSVTHAAKLVCDVIDYDRKFESAVLHVVGNSLVCESIDDARELAWNSAKRRRVVAIDGTVFEPSGLMSGGTVNIESRSQAWKLADEKSRTIRDRKRDMEQRLRTVVDGFPVGRRGPAGSLRLDLEINGLRKMAELAEKQKHWQVGECAKLTAELKCLDDNIKTVAAKKLVLEQKQKTLSENLMKLKSSVEEVENEIFHDFCLQVGVSTIRDFGDDASKFQDEKERAVKCVELKTCVARLRNLLHDDERRIKKGQQTVSRCEKTVAHNEQTLRDIAADSDTLKQDIQRLEAEIQAVSTTVRNLAEQCSTARLQLAEMEAQLQTQNSTVAEVRLKVETHLENIDGLAHDRHQLLRHARECKVDLPLVTGSLTSVSFSDERSVDELEIVVDYSAVEQLQLQTFGGEEQRRMIADLEEHLQGLRHDVDHMSRITDMTAEHKKIAVRQQLEECREIHREKSERLRHCTAALRKVCSQRHEMFMQCFRCIADNIDNIYKELHGEPGAQALLDIDNVDEPFHGGVLFGCIAPGKRYRAMEEMSGGEKTMAALAFIFAMKSFKPAPFYFMDEIDASLDTRNVRKLAKYLKRSSGQYLLISLKEDLFTEASALIGIYYQRVGNHCVSHVAGIVDLDIYREPGDSLQGTGSPRGISTAGADSRPSPAAAGAAAAPSS